MEELLISHIDLAFILYELDLPESASTDLLKNIWDSERAFLSNGYVVSFTEWIQRIQYWLDHIHEKESLNHGIRTIWNEIANQGGEIDGKNYLRDDLEFALFFKSLRIVSV